MNSEQFKKIDMRPVLLTAAVLSMAIVLTYGYFEAKDLLKVGLVLTAVEALILVLLVPAFWPLIGH